MIQFYFPAVGSTSIFGPARQSTTAAVTEFMEAPFFMFREWCPQDMTGIRLEDLTEQNP
jgi:hypothetical protein